MTFVQIFVAFAAAVTLFYSIGCLNRMTSATDHSIRAAYVLIAAGAFGEVAAIFDGHIPGIAETLFIGGFGLLDFIDRRCPIRCRIPKLPPENEARPCLPPTN